ncbi:TAXI family TRAP transporter solute-binding subunit [Pseudaestuariivita atlantica]|uniref:C4-dicarboxylate ABC transporter substrate-binding protein n=1 Tax=Pseudaestuariivita atlantica TaxID=1317121 RepID=A0A0L1JTP0_9RHOB|nr:TAXI family TRAP transporter solute-binding subunit [Pseudaestuariivita atlantica]KNG95115.1 C4-dicarboxylate ABC transporter substrate-binding protein [Pseudaestuariivita atlantica]
MTYAKSLAGLAVAAVLCAGGAAAQANLTAETAAATGVPGNTVLALGEFAAAAGVADIQVATGQTLTNSLQNTAEGKTDVTASPFILPFLLQRGAGPYAKLGPEAGAELADRLAVLYTYRFGVFTLSAYDSSRVKGWDDLAGATVYNGPPRGAALTNARGVAKIATGLDDGDGYSGVQVNWDQGVKTMTDGTADAFILPSSFPDGRHTRAVAAGRMTMWSYPRAIFESEAAQKYMKAPGSGRVEMPLADAVQPEGVTVVSEDDTFRGIATVGGEIVRKDMDEDLAYRLTKAVLDNLEGVRARAPFMRNIGLGEIADTSATGMCGPMPLKYHPGAIRAWEEAGYTVPDCARP